MSIEAGVLYVVATPIGNLGDMGERAVAVLRQVALVAAEDTRHSAHLLRHFAIRVPMQSLHEHNERQVLAGLVERLRGGDSIALISDAGTPLVSDPGFQLVRAARAAGVTVVPIPGPSAVLAALSVSGLPTDRFLFAGFLPSKSGARRTFLEELRRERATLVFFEAPHRIEGALADLVAVFGASRRAVLARELTKVHETVLGDTLGELAQRLAADPGQQRGEMVLVVQGAEAPGADELAPEVLRVAAVLAQELPAGQAAALAARITGEKKNRIYKALLAQDGAVTCCNDDDNSPD